MLSNTRRFLSFFKIFPSIIIQFYNLAYVAEHPISIYIKISECCVISSWSPKRLLTKMEM